MNLPIRHDIIKVLSVDSPEYNTLLGVEIICVDMLVSVSDEREVKSFSFTGGHWEKVEKDKFFFM